MTPLIVKRIGKRNCLCRVSALAFTKDRKMLKRVIVLFVSLALLVGMGLLTAAARA